MAHFYKPYKPVKVAEGPSPNAAESPAPMFPPPDEYVGKQPSGDDDPTLYSYGDLKDRYEASLEDDDEYNVYDSAEYDAGNGRTKDEEIDRRDYSSITDGNISWCMLLSY